MAITKINTPELLDINTTGAKQLPSGTTAQRPTTGLTAGDFRYNTDDNRVEYYDGSAWFQIDDEALPGTCTTNTINYPVAVTAYYKMSDATDQTGNYNGTATNVDFNVQGKFGNAGEFNGSSSGITSSSLGTALNVSSLSFSLWFKTNLNDSTDRILISSYDGSGNARFYASLLNSGLSVVIYGSSSTYIQNFINTVTTGTWYHLSVTHTGTTTTVYLNGTAITPSSTTGSPVAIKIAGSPQPLTMGQLQGSVGTYDFNGSIDQVRIFSSVLTTDNVTSLYNEVQCAPTIVPTNNFNVNTYFGTGATQAIDAKFNEAANFNGSSSEIEANGLSISGNTSFSISLWVKPNDVSTEQWIIQYGASSPDSTLYLQLDSSGFSVNNFTTGQYYSLSITANNWYHCVIGYDSSASEIFIQVNNGTRVTKSATVNISSSNLLMGHRSGASSYFNGSIDQVRIFDTALTGTQVTDLYNNETDATAQLLNFPVGAGCIAAYELDGNADDISGLYSGTPTDIGYTGMEFAPDLVWIKNRDATYFHALFDSIRGANKVLSSNNTDYENQYGNWTQQLTSFDSNGFSLGNNSDSGNYVNISGDDYVSWNWRAAGFANAFNVLENGTVTTSSSAATAGITAGSITTDWNVSANRDAGFSIVKYTGNSTTGATVGHGLSEVPEIIIVKRLQTPADNWPVYNVTIGNSYRLALDASAAKSGPNRLEWNNTTPTTTVFTLGNHSAVNQSSSYIAYCFHSVDGFSKIGSYTGTGASGNSIVTGFRPAFLMWKASSGVGSWYIFDNKRTTSNPQGQYLQANESAAEGDGTSLFNIDFLTNGFVINGTNNEVNANGGLYIFMAFAAEPTPEPVLANSFKTVTYTGNGASAKSITSLNFAPDLVWIKQRTDSGTQNLLQDTVRGIGSLGGANILYSDSAEVESTNADSSYFASFNSNGFTVGSNAIYNNSGKDYVAWCWKAGGLSAINNEGSIESIVSANPASGFSVVTYTGNTTAGATIGHGLNNTPELILFKRRNASNNWLALQTIEGVGGYLDLTNTMTTSNYNAWVNNTSPTDTLVTLNNYSYINGGDMLAYCFTSIAGYQKIGSYPGTGVNGNAITGVGFQPTWLLVKRTDAADNWVIVDSARGVSLSLFPDDPSQELNNSGAVSFELDGFTVNGASGGWNNGSGTYIYLAIK